MTDRNIKTIAVKRAGTREMPRDVEIEAGTTAYDLLRTLDLDPDGFTLRTPGEEVLKGNDPLYPKVDDGDKILLTEEAVVG